MIPLLAFTVACGETARHEARACETSFRRFHPDIPFLTICEDDYQLLAGGHPPAWPGEIVSMRTLAGGFLSRQVKRLIYLDSDLWVLGRLEKLIEDSIPTVWTRDWAVYTMGVPDCPRINSGVLASSDPVFWATWLAPQFGCLLPALPKFYFNQLSLRLIVKASAVRGQVIDGFAGQDFYNVSIGEHPGDWRVENGQVFKGAERALIYHQAGEGKRGLNAAPPLLQPFLREISSGETPGPTVDFAELWKTEGESFSALLKEALPLWPTLTLDTVLKDQYAKTPGFYRSVAPAGWDRYRKIDETRWKRFWHREWLSYIYQRADESSAPSTATGNPA